MSAASASVANISALFGRLSRDELLELGHALIHQSRTVEHTPTQQSPNHRSFYPQSPNHNIPYRTTRVATRQYPPPPMRQHTNEQPAMQKTRPLMEPPQNSPIPTSTPRRPASDSFDNGSHSTKRAKNNNPPPRTTADVRPKPTESHQPATSMQTRFNMNVLRRAVSDLLPCFHIAFKAASNTNLNLSSTHVAILLKKILADNQLKVTELSMCTQAGERRFKFAVNNKIDFLTLYNWTWPNEIDKVEIEVTKPRTLPDSLALVVRYIPCDVTTESAKNEIMKAIPAAVSFSTLTYPHRQRSTYDIRFCVLDLQEYQTSLELGRIAIGQHYLPITTYLPGYKLTYCTACWQLGHVRKQCSSPVLCRKCLSPFADGTQHFCADNSVKCAQCHGNHTSMNPVCPIVKQYKHELKLAVDTALANGSIERTIPSKNVTTFRLQSNPTNYPSLPDLQSEVRSNKSAWQTNQARPQTMENDKAAQELTSMIQTLKESTDRIEKRLTEVIQQNEQKDTGNELNRKCILAIIDSLHSISK